MSWPKEVTIKEVGPRDGLQNEIKMIKTEDKISWINELSESGLNYIEITSFVHPKWIPALGDAVEVAKGIKRNPDVTYAALVPNLKGLERALEANVDETSIFMSASETHNKKNINKKIAETLPILKEVVHGSLASGKTVRAYLSTVFGCSYEGAVDPDQVVRVSDALLEMGVSELSLGDTIGVANPQQVEQVLEILLKQFPKEKLAMHFHNTHGTALANVVVSLQMDITTFDSSLGGLGGCPYAPGASGNLATDDLVYMLNGMGVDTGVKEDQLQRAAAFIEEKVAKPLQSNHYKACQATRV
ncbi:hydroxymethylglutaryl-CoA lyase [Alteribacillus sp. JSM 102045]|uniref:hydroxymethylglutaryl-CoA lyase n=1 Tax=Alteribacillus sp. JSM 102045 TaxID=1562101 RepID=UPI0035BFBB59